MERIDYAQAKTLLKVVVDLMRDDTQKPGVGLELRSTFEKDPEAFFSDHGLFEGDLANVLMRCVMVTPPGKESKARRANLDETLTALVHGVSVPAPAAAPSNFTEADSYNPLLFLVVDLATGTLQADKFMNNAQDVVNDYRVSASDWAILVSKEKGSNGLAERLKANFKAWDPRDGKWLPDPPREPRWADPRAEITGVQPTTISKSAKSVDLVVTGAGIMHTAEFYLFSVETKKSYQFGSTKISPGSTFRHATATIPIDPTDVPIGKYDLRAGFGATVDDGDFYSNTSVEVTAATAAR